MSDFPGGFSAGRGRGFGPGRGGISNPGSEECESFGESYMSLSATGGRFESSFSTQQRASFDPATAGSISSGSRPLESRGVRGAFGGLGASSARASSSSSRSEFGNPERTTVSTSFGRGYGAVSGGGFQSQSVALRGGAGGGGRGCRGGFGGAGSISNDKPMPTVCKQNSLIIQPLGHGSEGRPVDLITNFYKFNMTDIRVYHYDVDITRDRNIGARSSENVGPEGQGPAAGGAKSTSTQQIERLSPTNRSVGSDSAKESSEEAISNSMERFIKKFSPKIVEKMVATKPDFFKGIEFCYDGYKNMYTVVPFNFGPGKRDYIINVPMEIDGRKVDFTARLLQVDSISTTEVFDFYSGRRKDVSERVISIYEIVFRNIMAKHFHVFQRRFFDMSSLEDSRKVDLAQFVGGFTSAVRMTEFGLALNLHLRTSCVVHRQFIKLSDLVERLGIGPNIAQSSNNGNERKAHLVEVNRFIRHLKVFTKHSKRQITYTIDGLIDQSPWQVSFVSRDGSRKKIEEYFRSEYGKNLLDLPLVRTFGRNSRYLPQELCYLEPNQFLNNSKINSKIQAELLFKSTNLPNVYWNKMDSFINKVASNEQTFQKQFGVTLDTRPVSVKGRVLPMPRLLNERGRFHTSSTPPLNWAVLCLDLTKKDRLEEFISQMMERSNELGLALCNPYPIICINVVEPLHLHNLFHNLVKKAQCEFVFVGIPSFKQSMNPTQIYGLIKYNCDQKFGIISQCFQADYINEIPRGYFDNFLLKVNGKLGGRNVIIDPMTISQLPFDMNRTMLIGIDVNHPSENERVSSSVSAAVGSVDHIFTSYVASIRVQKKEKDEMVKYLDQMIVELLEEYCNINKYLPDNLIIFRDGISEGQFEKVRCTEIPLIQAAINQCGKPMRITLIVVQKHHHTRFALLQQQNISMPRRPSYNVQSGTVVDSSIVEPIYKSFYLNSHFSPIGTSKPTKYVILRDDLNMSADSVQRMCFVVCFNSIRTRGVIAIPTAIRYADLCAYRTKLHVEAQRDIVDETIDGESLAKIEEEIIKRLNELVKVNEQIKNKLYYC